MVSSISRITLTLFGIFASPWRRLILLGAFLLPFTAQAASFDCAMAKNERERAICDDPELSALDEELAEAYRNALDKMEDAEDLRVRQRTWLRQYMPLHHLKESFKHRIEFLNAIPVFPRSSDPVEGPTFQMNDRSKHYDFTLRMLQPCQYNADHALCENMGQIFIYRKNQAKIMQIINTTIYISLSAEGVPDADRSNAIRVVDYNFDGHEDIGVMKRGGGEYGTDSETVYLFDSKQERFMESEAMFDLTRTTLGLMQVDSARKRLITMSRSGCCFHETSVWKVVQNTPVRVEQQTVSSDWLPAGCRIICDERLENGEWRWKTTRQLAPGFDSASCESIRVHDHYMPCMKSPEKGE
jgi:hypothetical protein